MERRKFIKQSSGTLLLATPLSAVAAQAKPAILHYVLFWLKPGLTEKQVKEFTGFFEELRKIKLIKSLSYGRAAGTTKRDVVDNTFTYAMLAGFDSIADQDRYQTDPAHEAAIKKYSGFWQKVVVHDAIMS